MGPRQTDLTRFAWVIGGWYMTTSCARSTLPTYPNLSDTVPKISQQTVNATEANANIGPHTHLGYGMPQIHPIRRSRELPLQTTPGWKLCTLTHLRMSRPGHGQFWGAYIFKFMRFAHYLRSFNMNFLNCASVRRHVHAPAPTHPSGSSTQRALAYGGTLAAQFRSTHMHRRTFFLIQQQATIFREIPRTRSWPETQPKLGR